MENTDIIIVVIILCILTGIIINYNNKENIFGTNMISIGIICYVCMLIFRKQDSHLLV